MQLLCYQTAAPPISAPHPASRPMTGRTNSVVSMELWGHHMGRHCVGDKIVSILGLDFPLFHGLWWLAVSIISTDCLHPRLREPEYGHMRNGMRAASSRDSVWQEPGNYEEFLVRVACAQLIECFVMIRKLPGASCTSPPPPPPPAPPPPSQQ